MKSPTEHTILECAFYYTNIFIDKKERWKRGTKKGREERQKMEGQTDSLFRPNKPNKVSVDFAVDLIDHLSVMVERQLGTPG